MKGEDEDQRKLERRYAGPENDVKGLIRFQLGEEVDSSSSGKTGLSDVHWEG